MTKRSWAFSLAIHALLLALLLAIATPTLQRRAEPMRWQVALLDPAPAAPSPPPRAAEPPRSSAPPRPAARLSSVPPPRPPAQAARTAPPEPAVAAPAAAAPMTVPPAVQASTPEPAAPATPAAPVVEAPAALSRSVAAAPAPPKAAVPRVDAEAQRRWYAALAAKLAELKRYPLAARRLGQEGVVLLEALIQPDGQAEVAVKQGSGYPALDRAALALFQEALRALPERLAPAQASRLDVPIAYRLEH